MRSRNSKFQIQQRIHEMIGVSKEDGAGGASPMKTSASTDNTKFGVKGSPVMVRDIHKKVAQARDNVRFDQNASLMSTNTFELCGTQDVSTTQEQPGSTKKTLLRGIHNASQPFASTQSINFMRAAGEAYSNIPTAGIKTAFGGSTRDLRAPGTAVNEVRRPSTIMSLRKSDVTVEFQPAARDKSAEDETVSDFKKFMSLRLSRYERKSRIQQLAGMREREKWEKSQKGNTSQMLYAPSLIGQYPTAQHTQGGDMDRFNFNQYATQNLNAIQHSQSIN